jgi:hypothetical protein
MNMISQKNLTIVSVILFSLLIMTLITLNKGTSVIAEKTKELEKNKLELYNLQKVCDSLYDENFPCQIELGRYQVAYQIFMERNPKAASQYGDIISEETE